MSIEKTVPITTAEGNEYLIEFSLFPEEQHNSSIPIVDVAIVATKEVKHINTIKSLFIFTKIIHDYLKEHDVILYYYCDKSEIKKNRNISPQEYRHILFSTLFEKKKDRNILQKSIKIDDVENGNHFITLISKWEHINDINKIIDTLVGFNKY